MSVDTIWYGIIGCGGHALDGHALHGKQVANLGLYGLYDPKMEQMDALESAYGTTLVKFESEVQMLQYSHIEAVLIASADQYHLDSLERAIEHGKHVLVEKPLITDASEVERLKSILARAKEKGLVVSSCHARRFDPPFLMLKRELARPSSYLGHIGPPQQFHFDFSYHRPTATWKHDRSLMLDHLNHEIDLMHFLFGYTGFEARKICDAYNRYEVHGKRDDGLTFLFHGTRGLMAEKHFLERVRVRGVYGEFTLDCATGLLQLYYHDAENLPMTMHFTAKTDYEVRSVGVMKNFVAAIRGEEQCYLTHDDLVLNSMTGVMLQKDGYFRWPKPELDEKIHVAYTVIKDNKDPITAKKEHDRGFEDGKALKQSNPRLDHFIEYQEGHDKGLKVAYLTWDRARQGEFPLPVPKSNLI